MLQFNTTNMHYLKAAELLIPQLIFHKNENTEVCTIVDGESLIIQKVEDGWNLQCKNLIGFARGLSLIAQFSPVEVGFKHEEKQKFETLTTMIDCSRNAVPTVQGIKKILIHLALMGYSNVQLYTEDTFQIEKYHYFGYLRGAYTQEELVEIDAFASSIGIEIVPCIQTLAHLLHALKWREFDDMWDCNDIVLCREEKTYELIDEMFKVMSSCFKSRHINIGMDEAHMLGLGKYLDKHGYHNRFEIMIKHLTRVMDIAKKYNYQPMMWSDMFFRLANNGEYSPTGEPIPESIIESVPKDVSMVYWDYYSEDKQHYIDMMESHQLFENNIIFASGIWKWTGFTAENEASMKIAKIAAEACIKCGITDILVTCWGDNGAESSMFSALPALAYWAELCWVGVDMKDGWLKNRFKTTCGIQYDDFMLMETPIFVPSNPAPGELGLNPPKYYFYQDPLLGMADFESRDNSFSAHYASCALLLKKVEKENPAWELLFKTQSTLCDFLELKVNLGLNLRDSYKQNDKKALDHFANMIIPELLNRLTAFQKAYHAQWLAENKPFGMDNFDIRTGGLRQRLITAAERINAYTLEEIDRIEELETEILPFKIRMFTENSLNSVHWEKISTPSSLFWM